MTTITGWCLSHGVDQHLQCPGKYGSKRTYQCPCYCHGAQPNSSKEDIK